MKKPPILIELLRVAKSWRIVRYLIRQQLLSAHRNKLLGNLWLLLDPLAMMVVLYLVFSNIRHLDISFSLYLLSGLLAWDIFTKSVNGSVSCISANESLILKYPFPLSVFPVSVVFTKVYDAMWGLIAYAIIHLGIVLFADNISLPLGWQSLLLPVWLLFYLLFTLGLALIVAGLGVFFRDMEDIVTVVLRLCFFLNPIFITMDHIPAHWHQVYFLLNPLAGFLLTLRQLLPGGSYILNGYQIPVDHYWLYLAGISVAVFYFGYKLFIKGQPHYTKYL